MVDIIEVFGYMYLVFESHYFLPIDLISILLSNFRSIFKNQLRLIKKKVNVRIGENSKRRRSEKQLN